jgi:hypothetical protein
MAKRDHTPNPELERLLGPTGYEVSCDECFELLDQYVELEIDGSGRRRAHPGAAQPPRRLPRVPGGARQSARPRHGRASGGQKRADGGAKTGVRERSQ